MRYATRTWQRGFFGHPPEIGLEVRIVVRVAGLQKSGGWMRHGQGVLGAVSCGGRCRCRLTITGWFLYVWIQGSERRLSTRLHYVPPFKMRPCA